MSKNYTHQAFGALFGEGQSRAMIGLNAQGIGNPWTVDTIRNHIEVYNPDFIFLLETKIYKHQANILRLKLGFGCCFMVDRVGMSGGLALYWKEEYGVHVSSFLRFHIEARCLVTSGSLWRFLGIYGNPKASQRRFTWDLLCRVHSLSLDRGFMEKISTRVSTILRNMMVVLQSQGKLGFSDKPSTITILRT